MHDVINLLHQCGPVLYQNKFTWNNNSCQSLIFIYINKHSVLYSIHLIFTNHDRHNIFHTYFKAVFVQMTDHKHEVR